MIEYDNGLILTALANNVVENYGYRIMLCPRTYKTTTDLFGNNWLGVWQSTLTPSINDLVIWGGMFGKTQLV